MDNFKRFNEEKLPDKKCLYRCVKDGTTGDNGGKLDGHIKDKDYLGCKIVWNESNMKNTGDYYDHYLKKKSFVISSCFWKVYWNMLQILQASL